MKKPLMIFDLETTGTDISTARIVSFGAHIIEQDANHEPRLQTIYSFNVNPGIPIPKEASDVHGITDEMVADCPSFKEYARGIWELTELCDVAGYNLLNFDIPVLAEELLRVDESFVLREDLLVVDCFKLWHHHEPRTLEGALKYFCNETIEDAHNAYADCDLIHIKPYPSLLKLFLSRHALLQKALKSDIP